MMSMLLIFLFACLSFLGLCEFEHATRTPVYGSRILSPTVGLIIARVSIELFPKFTQNLMLFLCRIHREISSRLQLDFQDMLVLSSAVASRYYNCCKDGSNGPGNFIHFIAIFYH
jgi:hypothetical protein